MPRFSYQKFSKLSLDSRKKYILKFIEEINKKWENESSRIELLVGLNEFLCWMNIESDISTKSSREEFLTFCTPLERKFGREMTDAEFLITDGKRENRRRIPLTLILHNLRSSFNVGSIFRSAECFGIQEIITCGYTANPNNKKVQKTAMGTAEKVKWQHCDQIDTAISLMKQHQCFIYALEISDYAKNLDTIDFEKPAALILGNEALGLNNEILAKANQIVTIPLAGWKNSLNVGVAAAIACYEFYRNWKVG